MPMNPSGSTDDVRLHDGGLDERALLGDPPGLFGNSEVDVLQAMKFLKGLACWKAATAAEIARFSYGS
jgi:hypothetical protein